MHLIACELLYYDVVSTSLRVIIKIYIYIYRHSGYMATPALGMQDVRLHIVGKDCIVESPECSNCKQWVMLSVKTG